MSKPTKKQPQPPDQGAQGHPDDEVVHVPKGTSPLRFIVTVGLMLFVLVIFTVGDQLVGSFRNKGGSDVYMSWEHPTAGAQRYGYPDFIEAKRSLDDFYRVTTGRGLGRDQGSDETIAYHIIAERMSQEAGVEVPDAELARAIREGEPGLVPAFISRNEYLGRLQSYGVAPQDFESSLRRVLRVRRYEMLQAMSLGQPEPADIEASWKEAHQEFAFDLVGLTAEDVRAEAEAEAPDDEGLRAWYDGLAEQDRTRLFFEHFTPVRTSAAVLAWETGGPAPAALLERFPRPESPSLEDLAQTYYNRFRLVRFSRPVEEPETPDEGGEPPPPPPPEAFPFEEVREQALAEAPIHAALIDLLKDLNSQIAAGEEPDIAALATELGLIVESDGLFRSRDEWTESAGAAIANAIASNQPPNFSPFPVMEGGRLAIVRAIERTPTAAPEFDAVVAEARTAWIDERAAALVDEKLGGLREALNAAAEPQGEEAPAPVGDDPAAAAGSVDAETFNRLVSEAGLTAQHLEWFDPARKPDDEESLSDAENYLRSSYFLGAELFTLEEGGIAGPLRSFQDERQWVVRGAGKRDPAEIDLRPGEYTDMSQRALLTDVSEVLVELRSFERLQRDFALDFPFRTEGEGTGQDESAGDGG